MAPSLTPFFKVLLPGFHQILKMPPAISDELIEEGSERVILQTKTGKWKVKLSMNKETGVICLKQGWPEFVKRHELKLGEFVFFEDAGDLYLNVTVYTTNFCEREFTIDNDEEDEEEEEEEQTLIPARKAAVAKVAQRGARESMICVKTMVPFCGAKNSFVGFPIAFMRLNNIGATQTSVVLIDREGSRWEVKLAAENLGGYQYRMRAGWYDFYTKNRLKDGDKCVFSLNLPLLTSTTITFDVDIIRAT